MGGKKIPYSASLHVGYIGFCLVEILSVH
ncbi:hypothetical protein CBU_0426a [Coxiella burnetii RSA 493]|uniref:Uncharacterized protein n=1 Tax=Coxiella burnetii (strain RSA 493 / Nine Mile phase I) TaxID=227377 RepID=B5QS90_COXBU|nr:hypothetical protein CBU_0426a [Coxiella burnetii RSA 493]BBL37412.1 hypothetical protein CBU406_C15200 [Coxiella burnetii]BBL38234.1 hypothetical protein CBUVS42_C04060 [Coxiella burnetii]